MKRIVMAALAAAVLAAPAAGGAHLAHATRTFEMRMPAHGMVMDLSVTSTGDITADDAYGCATMTAMPGGAQESFCGAMRLSGDPALADGSVSGIIFSTTDDQRMLLVGMNWSDPLIATALSADNPATIARDVYVSGGIDGVWGRNDAWGRPAHVTQTIDLS